MKYTLTTGNDWSPKVPIQAGSFNFSISGTFSATITVQRTFNNGTNWFDVETFTVPGQYIGTEGAGCLYRVGIKSGEYVSGSADIVMVA